MLVINDTVSLGDTLTTFPTVSAILQQAPRPAKVFWTNRSVGTLFPHDRYGAAVELDIPRTLGPDIIRISLHDFMWKREGWGQCGNGSFHQSVLRRFGFQDAPCGPVEIAYPRDSAVPSYDFVIAPCVLNNAWKNMSCEFWQEIAEALRRRYNGSVCAIGTSSIPDEANLMKIEADVRPFKDHGFELANLHRYLRDVDYFWDEPLVRVAQLMANVKRCFISVDSGPSHLMRAVGGRHLEIFGRSLVYRGSRDECLSEHLPAPPTLEDVINLLDEVFSADAH